MPCALLINFFWYIEREVREGRNLTCTSKPQVWHAPSKRQSKLHQPDTIDNIEIKKPKIDNIFTSSTKYERSSFDPRAPHHRVPIKISQEDCDIMASATNGNCGIVLLMREHGDDNDVQEPEPCNFVEIETSEHIDFPKTIQQHVNEIEQLDVTLDEKVQILKENVTICEEQAVLVTTETLLQSESTKWFEHRKFRITASKFKMVTDKVKKNNTVKNVNKVKAVFNICGYYKQYNSKAAKWGIENEDNARKLYVKEMKKSIKNSM